MNKIKTSILILIGMLIFIPLNYLYAGEVVLCLNEEEQYVITVNGKGDCHDGEDQIVMNSADMDQKKDFVPLANFKEDKDCNGKGTMIEIGFDENDNGTLEQSEIVSMSGSCNPADVPE